MIYANKMEVADILKIRRPPNKKLWSVFFDSSSGNQKAIPFHKLKKDSSWATLEEGFSSKEIKALNFAKGIPLDSKFMLIIGGTLNGIFPDQQPKSGKFNLFLVDLFSNEIHMKKTVNSLRLFAACARGGVKEPFKIYMIGGQEQ